MEKEVATSDPSQFTIGVEATCTDGLCGEVTQVVVDPIAGAVTDLIVEPKHRQGLGRLENSPGALPCSWTTTTTNGGTRRSAT